MHSRSDGTDLNNNTEANTIRYNPCSLTVSSGRKFLKLKILLCPPRIDIFIFLFWFLFWGESEKIENIFFAVFNMSVKEWRAKFTLIFPAKQW